MLSNQGIRMAIVSGQLAIENLQDEAIQPASIDLHLGNQFIKTRKVAGSRDYQAPLVDPFDEESIEAAFEAPAGPPMDHAQFRLFPGEFVLAATERVTLGNELVGQVAGKSSLARLGLYVESAGFIDPGFDGPITLELYNVSPNSILLAPGMAIAQICISKLDTPANPAYSGKYTGATGPQASRYYLNQRPAEAKKF